MNPAANLTDFFADLKELWHEMIPNQMQRAIILCFQLSDELSYLDVQHNSRVTYFNGLEFTTWNSFARLSGDIMVGIMIEI